MKKPRSGFARFTGAVRNLIAPRQQPAPDPDDPHWREKFNRRLEAVEAQLNNQNRLLLLTLIGIATEYLFRVVNP